MKPSQMATAAGTAVKTLPNEAQRCNRTLASKARQSFDRGAAHPGKSIGAGLRALREAASLAWSGASTAAISQALDEAKDAIAAARSAIDAQGNASTRGGQ